LAATLADAADFKRLLKTTSMVRLACCWNATAFEDVFDSQHDK
jgi:hypothetical protein